MILVQRAKRSGFPSSPVTRTEGTNSAPVRWQRLRAADIGEIVSGSLNGTPKRPRRRDELCWEPVVGGSSYFGLDSVAQLP
jgi:hypothetical protein